MRYVNLLLNVIREGMSGALQLPFSGTVMYKGKMYTIEPGTTVGTFATMSSSSESEVVAFVFEKIKELRPPSLPRSPPAGNLPRVNPNGTLGPGEKSRDVASPGMSAGPRVGKTLPPDGRGYYHMRMGEVPGYDPHDPRFHGGARRSRKAHRKTHRRSRKAHHSRKTRGRRRA